MPLIKLARTKYVVSIHDMAAWFLPEIFSKFYRTFIKFIIKRAISIADLIVVPSQTVKRAICNITKISENKVCVCYNPLKNIWKPIQGYHKGGYLLFVGSIDIHKNVITLMKAFAQLKKDSKYQHMKLLIVGKKRSGYKELNIFIKENSFENDISILGYISDKELLRLYNGAEALVMPSLYEGFGIPIIEAIAWWNIGGC